jgi:hypothetical protein
MKLLKIFMILMLFIGTSFSQQFIPKGPTSIEHWFNVFDGQCNWKNSTKGYTYNNKPITIYIMKSSKFSVSCGSAAGKHFKIWIRIPYDMDSNSHIQITPTQFVITPSAKYPYRVAFYPQRGTFGDAAIGGTFILYKVTATGQTHEHLKVTRFSAEKN